ncbi:mitochondrial translation elongation factor P (EF-P) [Andalucia godoyi]|uniref:Mitochondrial translation elongation factor P (EF-P) n=1 Tax=Andalucia godoyi TaxID=505711 RepID=A0A8K0AK45_ANDGO|nr:mitochondrial translation elongation factor P (EF-P) [Andalucia godoyi]|eukprot:ANDGO_02053.mRNA.1 mitochondrial translation elongation factor P (EF-P)
MFSSLLRSGAGLAASTCGSGRLLFSRGMKVDAINLRVGYVIQLNGKMYSVVKKQFNRTAQRAANIQLELRDLKSGLKTTDRLRTSDTVERVMMDQRRMSYLYTSDSHIVLMDPKTYDQIEVQLDILDEASRKLLTEGMELTLESTEGSPTSILLPEQLVVTVQSTDLHMKGQTQTPTYKPAVIENGLRIMVPPFIEEGERIIIKSEDLEYVGREKVDK